MTHWSKITSQTREFTDESYKPLHTPSEYFWTHKQKAEIQRKKEQDEKARRHRDMEERRRSQLMSKLD